MPLTTHISPDNTRYTILISGSFDITKADLFRDAFQKIPSELSLLDIDVAGVDCVDAAAMGMLFMLLQDLGGRMEIRLLNCSDDFASMLSRYGFDKLLVIHKIGEGQEPLLQAGRAMAG